jgi:hypothetical protein
MIKQLSAVAVAALALTMAPVAAAQAATPAASKPLHNPCRTFTVSSARTLLGVGSHVHLTEKLSSARQPIPSRTCTITHGRTRLSVELQRQEGGTGSEERCYKAPKLGSAAMLCVSNPGGPAFSFVLFHKDGVWVADGVNVRVPNKGKKLYQFALPQYKGFKG